MKTFKIEYRLTHTQTEGMSWDGLYLGTVIGVTVVRAEVRALRLWEQSKEHD